jgi:hypothetical protein
VARALTIAGDGAELTNNILSAVALALPRRLSWGDLLTSEGITSRQLSLLPPSWSAAVALKTRSTADF